MKFGVLCSICRCCYRLLCRYLVLFISGVLVGSGEMFCFMFMISFFDLVSVCCGNVLWLLWLYLWNDMFS